LSGFITGNQSSMNGVSRICLKGNSTIPISTGSFPFFLSLKTRTFRTSFSASTTPPSKKNSSSHSGLRVCERSTVSLCEKVRFRGSCSYRHYCLCAGLLETKTLNLQRAVRVADGTSAINALQVSASSHSDLDRQIFGRLGKRDVTVSGNDTEISLLSLTRLAVKEWQPLIECLFQGKRTGCLKIYGREGV